MGGIWDQEVSLLERRFLGLADHHPSEQVGIFVRYQPSTAYAGAGHRLRERRRPARVARRADRGAGPPHHVARACRRTAADRPHVALGVHRSRDVEADCPEGLAGTRSTFGSERSSWATSCVVCLMADFAGIGPSGASSRRRRGGPRCPSATCVGSCPSAPVRSTLAGGGGPLAERVGSGSQWGTRPTGMGLASIVRRPSRASLLSRPRHGTGARSAVRLSVAAVSHQR